MQRRVPPPADSDGSPLSTIPALAGCSSAAPPVSSRPEWDEGDAPPNLPDDVAPDDVAPVDARTASLLASPPGSGRSAPPQTDPAPALLSSGPPRGPAKPSDAALLSTPSETETALASSAPDPLAPLASTPQASAPTPPSSASRTLSATSSPIAPEPEPEPE